MVDRLKNWARMIKRDVHALYLASRHPRVPWYAKALAVVATAYALSPIDVITDFIPVLAVVAGIWVVTVAVVVWLAYRFSDS